MLVKIIDIQVFRINYVYAKERTRLELFSAQNRKRLVRIASNMKELIKFNLKKMFYSKLYFFNAFLL